MDETEVQTRRIHARQRQARTPLGLGQSRGQEAVVSRHHHAQRLVEPVGVVIPFVEVLRFPTRWLRTRRDHERFLSLVEVVCHRSSGGGFHPPRVARVRARPLLLGVRTFAQVFLPSRQQPFCCHTLAATVRRLAREAGLTKKVTPHVLRHSFATRLIDRDVPTHSVQVLLGHVRLASTEVYLHSSPARLAEAVGRISR